jgi:hypothetical protein
MHQELVIMPLILQDLMEEASIVFKVHTEAAQVQLTQTHGKVLYLQVFQAVKYLQGMKICIF